MYVQHTRYLSCVFVSGTVFYATKFAFIRCLFFTFVFCGTVTFKAQPAINALFDEKCLRIYFCLVLPVIIAFLSGAQS